MDKFKINGPSKIRGEVSISGSKNAALPILAATLLFDKNVTIKNLPRVKDIDTMLELIKSFGFSIKKNFLASAEPKSLLPRPRQPLRQPRREHGEHGGARSASAARAACAA